MGWRVFLGYSCYGSSNAKRRLSRLLFCSWVVCCVLLAFGVLGLWIVAAEGSDPARVSLVYAIFCAVGFILLRVIVWALSRQ